MDYNEISDFSEVLFTAEQLQEIVQRLGSKITQDYKNRNLLLIGLLKGSIVFLADLMREIKLPCSVDFMTVSSYGNGTESMGKVKILKDISEPIWDKNVLIIEDIIDSGNTLSFIKAHLESLGAKDVSICTLFDKPDRRQKDVYVKYVGAVIPDKFIVGYGLDYAESYRNVPFVGVLKKEIYS